MIYFPKIQPKYQCFSIFADFPDDIIILPETRCKILESFRKIQDIEEIDVLWIRNVVKAYGCLIEDCKDDLNEEVLVGLFNQSLIIGILQFIDCEKLLLKVKKVVLNLPTSKSAPDGWCSEFFFVKIDEKYSWYSIEDLLKSLNFSGTKSQQVAHFMLKNLPNKNVILVNEVSSGATTVLNSLNESSRVSSTSLKSEILLQNPSFYKISKNRYSGDGIRLVIDDLNCDEVGTEKFRYLNSHKCVLNEDSAEVVSIEEFSVNRDLINISILR